MSISHTGTETHLDPLSSPIQASVSALIAARTALFAAARTVRTIIVHRWTQRRLARLSDHLLRDFGFEREWDGTIRSLHDAS